MNTWIIDPATDLPPAVIEDTPDGIGVCECRTLGEARLIAAAPELLEALKNAQAFILANRAGLTVKPDNICAQILASIKKAGG